MLLPTREELLAAELPVERISTNSEGCKVTYRYATEEIADKHLQAEREILVDWVLRIDTESLP